MFGAILKATNGSFQKGITFYRSIYVKKITKLLAFIFEQPSYHLHLKLASYCMLTMTPSDCCVSLFLKYTYDTFHWLRSPSSRLHML